MKEKVISMAKKESQDGKSKKRPATPHGAGYDAESTHGGRNASFCYPFEEQPDSTRQIHRWC